MANLEPAERGTASATRFGKYELLDKIGSGGMAEIYKARLTGIGGFEKVVVVKRILPSFAANRSFVKMLIAEAKLSSSLHHANVVQIYELGEYDGQPFIAMEHVHGKDLLQILGRATKLRRKLPVELALFIASEVCKGLDYAHGAADARGNRLSIIHRDVSPSNIIISFDGLVKLTDFGVARASLERKQQTRSGVLKGKLGYMSPEQVLGAEFDHRADIFSAGIILYEALTLKRLFLGKTDLETLINIRDAKLDKKLEKHNYIPSGVQQILRRALSQRPEERFQRASEFHEAIQDYLFEHRIRADAARLGSLVRELFSDVAEESISSSLSANGEETTGIRDAATSSIGVGLGSSPDESSAPVGPHALAHASTSEFSRSSNESTPHNLAPQNMATTAVAKKRTGGPIAKVRLAESGRRADGSSPEVAADAANAPNTGIRRATFRLRNHEGQVFGPVTYSNFVNLLKTRSISEDEQVSINEADWQQVREISELHTMLPQFFEKLHHKPRHEGPVNQLTLPKLIHELASQRQSGTLKLTRGSTVKEVYFKVGRPRHIASSMKSELFGNYLVSQGVLTSAQLARSIEQARNAGTKLGEALLALHFVEPYELYRLLSSQFRSKFREILSWTHGWYEFHSEMAPEGDIVPLELEPIGVMAEGVREYYPMETFEVFFLDHLEKPYDIERDRGTTVEELRFNARESRFLSHLAVFPTLRDVLAKYGQNAESQQTILRVAFLLHQTGLLQFEASPLA